MVYDWLTISYETSPKDWATQVVKHSKEINNDLKVYKHFIIANALGITPSHLSYLKPLIEGIANANNS